jgi:tail tube protein gp19
MPYTQDSRAYTPGHVALELDGAQASWVVSAQGGEAAADVVEETPAPSPIARRHIGPVRYSDVELECGAGMSPQFYDWISETLSGNFARKNCAIVVTDYNSRELSRLTLSNALIAEVGFPALDGASKDPATMMVKLAPQATAYEAGSGTLGIPLVKEQKRWLPSNFRLRIGGLDCTQVRKIEPLVVTATMVDSSIGESRAYASEPARLRFSDLVITLAQGSAAQGFYEWAKQFILSGLSTPAYERSGTLEFMAPDLQEALFTLSFSGLGIHRLATGRVESGSAAIASVTAYMYYQQVRFAVGGTPQLTVSGAAGQPTLASPVATVADRPGLIAQGISPQDLVRVRPT